MIFTLKMEGYCSALGTWKGGRELDRHLSEGKMQLISSCLKYKMITRKARIQFNPYLPSSKVDYSLYLIHDTLPNSYEIVS